jgi:hypothetical protein
MPVNPLALIGALGRAVQRLLRPPRSNHKGEIWACDFLPLYDALFRPIFAFFFVVHDRREVVHFNVTRCPADAWVAQQLREATPCCSGPTYLIRDSDDKFGKRFSAGAEGTAIEV